MTHIPSLPKSIKVGKSQVVGIFKQIFTPLKQASTRTSALILTAGLGLSVLVPVYAVSGSPKNQLISQNNKKVEITLVSYAVTRVAYDKIIPQNLNENLPKPVLDQ